MEDYYQGYELLQLVGYELKFEENYILSESFE